MFERGQTFRRRLLETGLFPVLLCFGACLHTNQMTWVTALRLPGTGFRSLNCDENAHGRIYSGGPLSTCAATGAYFDVAERFGSSCGEVIRTCTPRLPFFWTL